MNDAIEILKKQFGLLEGCELHSLSYISDEKRNNCDTILCMNELEKQMKKMYVFALCALEGDELKLTIRGY